MKRAAFLSTFAIAGLSLFAYSNPNTAADGCSSSKAKTVANRDGGCSSSSATTVANRAGEKNIVETALAAGQFKTLAAALGAADLAETMQGKGPFTVFAPTDAAFAKLPEGTIATLLKPENKGLLTNILTYHVVSGNVGAKDVVKLKTADALNGQRLPILVNDAGVSVAGAHVTTTDIHCSNGVIHIIDTVMMPSTKNIVETAKGAGTFNTLVAAVGAADLAKALGSAGPFTVFAPTDAAFAALPEGTVATLLKPENKHKLVSILKYHVVPGRVYSDQLANGKAKTLQGTTIAINVHKKEGVTINRSKVTAADIDTTNGVIHVIDSVLLPE